jgi:hypothetical protein
MNTPIEGFPTKPQDIRTMTTLMLDALLSELGLGTDGTKLQKQQRARAYIGLRTYPA